MKIAIIPSWYNSPSAPTRGSFILDQAQGLRSRGYEILMIIPDRDAEGRLLSVTETFEDGLRCLRIAVPAPWHRLIGFYYPRLLGKIIGQVIDEFTPDIVHAHAVRPAGVLAVHALKNRNIPLCLTEHSGPLNAFWWTPHGKRQIVRAYQGATQLLAVSDFLRQEMGYHFGSAINGTDILHNGLDIERFSPLSMAPQQGKLLFVGGLEPTKGLGILFDALTRIPGQVEWTLSVVGTGPLEKELRVEASTLGLSERIKWFGAVDHDDMGQIYAQHDYIVVPSIHETFSLVCAEALACGRAVIATRCGGPLEIVPDFGGRLVEPNNPEALAEALEAALAGAVNFDQDRVLHHIHSKFSMSSLLDRLETIYQTLLPASEIS